MKPYKYPNAKPGVHYMPNGERSDTAWWNSLPIKMRLYIKTGLQWYSIRDNKTKIHPNSRGRHILVPDKNIVKRRIRLINTGVDWRLYIDNNVTISCNSLKPLYGSIKHAINGGQFEILASGQPKLSNDTAWGKCQCCQEPCAEDASPILYLCSDCYMENEYG